MVAIKRMVRCSTCGMCAYVLPPGFVSVPELHCTTFGDMAVDHDDGCTFGTKGEPFQATEGIEVSLDLHPADCAQEEY